MDFELESALEVATHLALLAGEVIAKHFRSGLAVDRKADNEPVTQADRDSEKLIIEGLHRLFPNYGILSEEAADRTSWREYERAWVVDPLDGTKEFIAGQVGFSVMIGLLENFKSILGIVHQPMSGLTFRAAAGAGCEMFQGAKHAVLHTTKTRDLAGIRLVTSKSHRSPIIDDIKQVLGLTDEQNVGSVGNKISLIARGTRDLYINPEEHCHLWDACAPEVILTEAGGRITDLFGDPIQYKPEELRLRRGVVASNGACHDAVIQAIAPLLDANRPR